MVLFSLGTNRQIINFPQDRTTPLFLHYDTNDSGEQKDSQGT